MKREDVLITLIFLLFVHGYLFRNVFSAILAFSIAVYLSHIRSQFTPKVVAWRDMKKWLQEGHRVKVRLKLKNHDGKVKVHISEELPFGFKAELPSPLILKENEEKEVEYSIIPAKGAYTIKGPKIIASDVRELYYQEFFAESEFEVEVYPSLDRIKEEVEIDTGILSLKSILIGLQSVEIDSLREYQPGDYVKYIDWKATARLGELIVREFLKEVEGDIYIILDAGFEMRKGVRNAKIDYATTLTLQLISALKRYRVGLIVYDDFGVKHKIEPSKSPDRIKKAIRSLNLTPVYSNIIGVKVPEISFRLKEESSRFLRKVLPVIKRRKSISTGLFEAVGSITSTGFLIFISDITAHTVELAKVLVALRDKHKILLITPNPILFYDESKLDKEKILWLYRRYVERDEIVKRFSRIVPTLDLGPSDLIEVIRGAL
ncbi:Uncharacterized conserved protein (some members containing a von Willebrand factor type A (vWA) domain) [Archaeoglobus sulfaticallidus PM70-1]|uniref:Uncharacterized conserved protein (Some members containing a von Willebrand factor type A (VWA) domain) n=1 Tax=Archaeoglobus sulfaticallidus PM70-1 TaxID=387631 RepID=N0BKL2_9EURY|nr:DUF58 domain-containing protein [Archaeoglobus sulfaticallidus]AGK61041.1 Uncharacterized conserved protein (some members containing a von Willebrand factor type A (vWA) domain) [Archaeoglobus sulfaticallidus PM70-1]